MTYPESTLLTKSDVEQAIETTPTVDREDQTSPEAADADQEDVVQRPQVPKRTRKSRARTYAKPEAIPMQQLQQPHTSPASPPAHPTEESDDVMPPLGLTSSDSEDDFGRKRVKDESSE